MAETKVKPKGRTPTHPLHQLLVTTAEGRKATTEERAFALVEAFRLFCLKNNLDPDDVSARAKIAYSLIETTEAPVAEPLKLEEPA